MPTEGGSRSGQSLAPERGVREGLTGHTGWDTGPNVRGVCVITSMLDSWLSSAARYKSVRM